MKKNEILLKKMAELVFAYGNFGEETYLEARDHLEYFLCVSADFLNRAVFEIELRQIREAA